MGANQKRRPSMALISVGLACATLAVYWQVQRFDFVNFDDNEYVYENPHVCDGLTAGSTAWAFTTGHLANWSPLTWLSYMLDVELFGPNRPGAYHVVNVLLHTANTLLLFLVLWRMTAAVWPSAFVAAVFALHPLHVESVAWISERKDVLSTLFWMLTLVAYGRYAAHGSRRAYWLALTWLVLGLLAKPMLVTLPCVLLLLDYWPLGRFSLHTSTTRSGPRVFWPLLREKIPLFAVAAISCVVTYAVQQGGGAVRESIAYPFEIRLANALVSYVRYLGKTVWPSHLAVFYPHPGDNLPIWVGLAAGLLLTVLTGLVFLGAKRLPYLLTGWLWFLGTLIPVIGIIQVGDQAMADRYTYVPLIGLAVIAAWGMRDLGSALRWRPAFLRVLGALVLVPLSACTWLQIAHWRNSETLFRHALDVTKRNALAHLNLGMFLADQGNLDGAATQFEDALRIQPNNANAHYNLGVLLATQGDLAAAIAHFEEAARIEPNHAGAYYNLGNARLHTQQFQAAADAFRAALAITPDDPAAHYGLALALFHLGDLARAEAEFTRVLQLAPNDLDARKGLELIRAARQGAQRTQPAP